MIKALVFDFDGTILDTEWTLYQSFKEIYDSYGVILPVDLWSQGVGSELVFDPFAHLEELIQAPIDRVATEDTWLNRHRELLQTTDLRPGVRDYLEAARNLGLKIGLASSSPRSWVDPHLKKYGIRDYFSCVLTKDDVLQVKPDPELYTKTLECLGVRPYEAIAVEDSVTGAKAAKAAGMYCMITPHELSRKHIFAEYDVRLESLAERQLEQVLEDFK